MSIIFCNLYRSSVGGHLGRPLLRRSLVGGILAPTEEQRLAYKDWLHVYGKARSRVTPRMNGLIHQYSVMNLFLLLFRLSLLCVLMHLTLTEGA